MIPLPQVLTNLPDILFFTGQSGAGKGSALSHLRGVARMYDIPTASISSGDLTRELAKKESHFAKKVTAINNTGAFPPGWIPQSMLGMFLIENYVQGTHFFIDGTPRWPEQSEFIIQLNCSGFFPRGVKVLEVVRDDETCDRFLEIRTREDKRPELSMDDAPGVYDPQKGARKLKAWTENRIATITPLQEAGIYLSLENNGRLVDFQTNVLRMFN